MKNGAMRNRRTSFTAMLAAMVCGSWGMGVASAQPVITDPITVFLDPVAFTAGSFPYGIVAADLLGDDGLPELVVANGGADVSFCGNDIEGPGTVTIYQNTGNWDPDPSQGLVIAQTIDLCADCVPAEVAISDINADGYQDIIVSTAGPDGDYGVYVVRNDGQGGFPQINIDYYPTALPVRGLSMADFNNDGYPDIAVSVDYCVGGPGAGENDMVFILKNPGGQDAGKFGILPQVEIHLDITDAGQNDIVTGEYNHDLSTLLPTRIDIISANMNDDNFSELENLGNWVFNVNTHDPAIECDYTTWRYRTITGDRFGADNSLDFACTIDKYGCVDVFLGDSTGSYTSMCDDATLRYQLTTSDEHLNGWGIDSGHLNGGTNIDLAVALMAEDLVSVLFGKANGHFRQPDPTYGYLYSIDPPADPSSTTNPIMVLIVDLNLDGFGDFVTTNHYSDNISVLINDLFVIQGP